MCYEVPLIEDCSKYLRNKIKSNMKIYNTNVYKKDWLTTVNSNTAKFVIKFILTFLRINISYQDVMYSLTILQKKQSYKHIFN
ncbi:LOW QUALITY PROTEIN: hypothetical protein V1478_014782 [Vespula squamosa]|uniref:Uncharacterized protein n=1 Tax=Vespula squamosa TaxID=30214 RepID=A0ABD2A3A1_VESSQ